MGLRDRARRQLLVTGLVLGYLAAAGVTLVLGDRVAGGTWLALHLVLLGAATNAIVVWSEHFAAALLRVPRAGERAAAARTLALNLGVLAVLAGVHAGRPVLLAGMGLGVLLAGGATGSADAYRAMRLAHVHLNVLGWVGLAVVGTQFTLWPTVLRTRMVADPRRAAGWSLPLMAGGLAVTAAGLLAQWRAVALAGLAGYAAGLGVALVPFARTAPRRRPHTAASWMLAAGIAWFAVAVAADLLALAASDRVVDLDGRTGRLVPAVAVGFGLQVLTGALTYLLPVVWGRGAYGNRRLTAVLEAGWRPRVAAANLGVLLLLVAGPPGGWAGRAGWWLAGLGLGAFVPLAAAALAWRVVEDTQPG